MTGKVLGVIGGSGVYDLPGLQKEEWLEVNTPWGKPSDKILKASLNSNYFYFLPRHGKNHTLGPSDINYRANIYALKSLGVEEILSFSACGSFKEELEPGSFVLVDQYIDLTKTRDSSFFGKGCVAHIPFSKPSCKRVNENLKTLFSDLNIKFQEEGTYLTIEGPQFSSYAESVMYKSVWHCDVIGMTNMPEAKLAREAEICYQTIAMVTDYDCWNSTIEEVTVEEIQKIFKTNLSRIKLILEKYISDQIAPEEECKEGCNSALRNSIVTPRENWDKEIILKMEFLLGKYL